MSDPLSSDLASLRINRDESPPSRLPRVLIALAILVGLGVAAWWLLVPYLEARVFKAEVGFTEIALVSPAQAQVELTSTGYVVPQLSTKVGAKEVGRIAKVNVREGDRVKEGDVLAALDDIDRKSAVASARSRVAAARARAQTARANLAEVRQQVERERRLVKEGVSPKALLDDLEARATALSEQVKAADAEARAAQAEVESAEVGVANMTITAPFSGTILTKPLEVGDVVSPQTAPLLEMADLDSLVVETDVPEARLHLVEVGSPTEIVLDAYPSKRHRGRVKEISPKVNRAKATAMVRVQFVDAREGALPEMSARVSFLKGELDAEAVKEPPKLVVPGSAVTDRNGAKVVFVVDGDKVRMTPIVLGPPFGTGFVLEKGPSAGTKVVKEPPPTLTDGQKVKERKG
jgi:RND family efflux transporter MFP subunit